MNNRLAAPLLAVLLSAVALPARAEAVTAPAAGEPASLHIVYLSREGDAAYQPVRAENGVTVPTLPEPLPGAELALRDTRAAAHARDLTVELDQPDPVARGQRSARLPPTSPARAPWR